MLETLTLLPITFWITLNVFAFGFFLGIKKIRKGPGLPVLAVLVTVLFWYVGDVFYNDYAGFYQWQFSETVLSYTWAQVSFFLIAFLVFVSLFTKGKVKSISSTYLMYKRGVDDPDLQLITQQFFKICFIVWILIVCFAFINVGGKALWFVAPILGKKVDPFIRGQVGGGFSAFFSLAQYLYILVGAGCGVVAAISKKQRIFQLAIIGCLLVWPYFLLDRTRNSMLVVCLPGILCWVFLRIRSSNKVRLFILIAVFIVINLWFSFVMDARGRGLQVSSLFFDSSVSDVLQRQSRHGGLNMYEELCWLTTFIERGSFIPNGGKRYFADLVNPIPRALWPGKPTIGLDYAVARGQTVVGDDGTVSATISTGMIGQGVSNFGTFFGPIVAGFLMAFWVRILAGIDCVGRFTLRMPLVWIGLVLTFNLGRDISLLILYPFIFGWLLIWGKENGLLKTRK